MIKNSLTLKADSSDYDPENDSLFLFQKDAHLETSLSLDNVILDMGADDTLIGFEVLHASKMFNVSKLQIQEFHHITAEYTITENTIEIKLSMFDDEDRMMNSFISSQIN